MTVRKASRSRRDEKKEQTRKALMEGVLQLVEEGQAFSAISLREVTRMAGVVPTSFYRHFQDMDELGLALVDEMGLVLRRQMREARQTPFALGPEGRNLIRRSVEIYMGYVQSHRAMFTFLVRERYGGNEALREAIGREIRFFAAELAADLERVNLFPAMKQSDLPVVAELVINTVAGCTYDILQLDPADRDRNEQLAQKMARQLLVIFLGAGQLQNRSGDTSERQDKN